MNALGLASPATVGPRAEMNSAAARLSALARYTARVYLNEQRTMMPSKALYEQLGRLDQHEHLRREDHEHARILRECVKRRDWLHLLDGLGQFGNLHFLFLERAFPVLSPGERAGYLEYVWCRCKGRVPPSRALRLFRTA